MDISKMNQNFSDAIKEVEKTGMITIEKYGKPEYVFMTYEFFKNIGTYFTGLSAISNSVEVEDRIVKNNCTLHEAMRTVLIDQPNMTMRYTDLANAIWERGLYRQACGKKAPSSQILLRARNYSSMFLIGGETNHDVSLK